MPKQDKMLSAKTSSTNKQPRRLKAPSYSSFRLQKRIKPVQPKMVSGYQLFKYAVQALAQNWKPFLGIILTYGVLNALFVQSFSGSGEISTTKNMLDEAFGGGIQEVVSSASIFVYLLGASGNAASETAGAYQMILTLITSLALVWTLREVYAGNKVSIRDGFYKGMYPLVPFLLVLCVILVQMVPLFIGLFLYNIATTQGVAVTPIEHILWLVFLCFAALLSFYWLAASIFALYIACLPDMTPFKAVRSARELVRFRRWTILRKIAFLPFMMLVVAGLIMIPIIWFITPLTPWVFFLMSMLILPLIHAYMYRLYRELL
jgi:hypothetical protein